MRKNGQNRNIFHKIIFAALLFLFLKSGILFGGIERTVLDTWFPLLVFQSSGLAEKTWFQRILEQQFPVWAYGDTESEYGDNLEPPEESEGRIALDDELSRRLLEENQTGRKDTEEEGGEMWEPGAVSEGFQKAPVRQQEYDWSYYQDFDALIREFYAVDASTRIGPDRLQLDRLRGIDLRMERNAQVPQILIYHTHSQEGFVDSVRGNAATTIVGAGERLAQILREEYGYNVIHHTGQFDVESRDYAYSEALPEIERILAEYPSIEVVIDLHRDEMLEGRRLVMDLNGRPTARLMFFNGLSHTREQGDIAYLENPYIEENLAFSFQLQVAANEYYPGLTRRIYLKGYRYNMHLRARSLLIELGAQTNTVEEIRNACDPIAHLLDLVLSG